MAWTAPATYSVSEVVTASKLNTHIRDNLLYLKGQAGAVAIEDDMTIGATTAAAARLHVIRSGGGVQEALRLDNVTNTAGNGSSVVWRNAAQSFHAALIQAVRNGSGTDFLLQFGASANFTSVDALVGMTLTSAGLGIGTAAPAGKLHVLGAGAGGAIFFESAVVAGTAVQVLPSGGLQKIGIVNAVAQSTDDLAAGSLPLADGSGFIAVGGSTNDYRIVDATPDFCVVRVLTNGTVQLIRTGGTKTYRVALWLVYW